MTLEQRNMYGSTYSAVYSNKYPAQNEIVINNKPSIAKYTSHKIPWKNPLYFWSATKSTDAKNQILPPQAKQCDQSEDFHKLEDGAMPNNETNRHPCEEKRKANFPFRKVIIGSKLIMLPEKDEILNKNKSNISDILDVPQPDTSRQETRIAQSMAYKTMDPKRPKTPPLGHSTRLTHYLQARHELGDIKGPQSQQCGEFLFNESLKHSPINQDAKSQDKKADKISNTLKTPMSYFKIDQKHLMNTLRNYKRDKLLQKERCLHPSCKKSANVANVDWFKHINC